MKKAILFTGLTLATLLFSCKKEDNQPITPPPGGGNISDHRVLVCNEGPFMTGSGTLSLVNITTGESQHSIFEDMNGFPLGNIVQSAYRDNGRLYVVVNNAGKIEVADSQNFTSVTSIENLGQPRFMVSHDGTGYVSDWASGGVHMVNLESHTITGTIETGSGPERMLVQNDEVWVTNSGGFSTAQTVSVIDANAQTLSATISVGDNPNSIAADADGHVRVLCRGVGSWPDPEAETAGSIWVLNSSTHEVVSTLTFPSPTDHPSSLTANPDGTVFYYLLGGNVFRLGIDDSDLPAEPWITGNFYSLGYHNEADVLLVGDAVDFQQDGIVRMYSSQGVETGAYAVGVIPTFMMAW
ncbi:MAG: hypothetical protein EA392_05370 [Cryomorphaceae bacterium]|nr:MAG: hypothetical protein EA392_05370 [Cryomorphaceae bacterium]